MTNRALKTVRKRLVFYEEDAKKRLANLRRQVTRARKFPTNTCSASRHLHIMSDCLTKKGGYPMLTEEPEHCAESILAVLLSLWEARTELAKLKGKK